MSTRIVMALVLAAAAWTAAAAEQPLDFSDETVRINYSLGYQIGDDFKRQGVEMNPDAVIQGIADALAGSEPKMSRPEMHETMVALKRKIEAEQRARVSAESEAVRQTGIAFLEENRTKGGVQVTASGLQYKVLEEGTGRSPGPGDTVKVNYRGTTVDGHEFDSCYARSPPAEFTLSGGWPARS